MRELSAELLQHLFAQLYGARRHKSDFLSVFPFCDSKNRRFAAKTELFFSKQGMLIVSIRKKIKPPKKSCHSNNSRFN